MWYNIDARDCKTNNGVETGMDVDEFCPWVIYMTMEEIEAMASSHVLKSHMPYNLIIPGGDAVSSPAKYNMLYVILKMFSYLHTILIRGYFLMLLHGSSLLISSFLVIFSLVLFTHTHLLGWWSQRFT